MNSSRRFALLGENIHYTRSPEIYAAIGAQAKCDIRFEVFDVPKGDVEQVIERMRGGKVDGLSVTIPHKEAVLAYVDRCSRDAETIGAVNCVATEDGKLVGHNTDWAGFIEPLMPVKERLNDSRIMILGSGGAARAAIYGLRTFAEIREYIVVSRNPGKHTALKSVVGQIPLRELPFDQMSEWRAVIHDCALIVNATPLGGGNHPDGGMLTTALHVPTDAVYYDLNYNHDNRLVQRARDAGATVIDGRQMLVAQAIQSFGLWTGQSVPFEPIYESVFGNRRR